MKASTLYAFQHLYLIKVLHKNLMFKEYQGTFPGYKRQADAKVKKKQIFFSFCAKNEGVVVFDVVVVEHTQKNRKRIFFGFSFSPKSENTSPVPFIPRKQTGQKGFLSLKIKSSPHRK